MFSSDLGQQFVDDLHAFCEQLSLGLDLCIETKSDNSLVTRIDQELSHFCKNHPSAAGFHFYSEEDHTTL